MQTPKNHKFRLNKRKDDESPLLFEPQIASTAAVSSPIPSISFAENESPGFFPLSQELDENIEVLWDWQSPNGERKRKKPRPKRLLPPQSPTVCPIKRPNFAPHTQTFDQLREELRALQEELGKPDDESCLLVSPQDEYQESPVKEKGPEPEDAFNDSLDDILVEFSQQVDQETEKKKDSTVATVEKNRSESKVETTTSDISFLVEKYKSNPIGSQTVQKTAFRRTASENVIQTMSGKLEMHRTKSFEMATLNVDKKLLEEIEKKRQAALALREAKSKGALTQPVAASTVTFSPEEIEAKKRQAMEKLEAKRLQEVCERNRQEALRRLQRSRMRKANSVKSSLDKRL